MDIFDIYRREALGGELLTPKEEIELSQKIKGGDEIAFEKMVKANLRLVVNIANTWQGNGLPLLDLINEGNIGLMIAVRKFESRGARFSTYATWWIVNSIRRAIVDKSLIIRVPIHASDKRKKAKRSANTLSTRLGREPTNEEISKYTKETNYKPQSPPKGTFCTSFIAGDFTSNHCATIGSAFFLSKSPLFLIVAYILQKI